MASSTLVPGLAGEWLNGWLAAVGVTVLLPGARLSYVEEGRMIARIELPDVVPLAEALCVALPSVDELEPLAIARPQISRRVTLADYQAAAGIARVRRDFSLAATLSDLGLADPDKELAHSPFDPPAPQGKTLWERLVRCCEALGTGAEREERVAASLAGRGARIEANGLGFDFRRLPAAALGSSQNRVDPVIECLAFFGLALFPVGGDGVRTQTRGWRWDPHARRTRFLWPTWRPALDRFAIDALLGTLFSKNFDEQSANRLGVLGVFQVVPYRSAGSSDVTSGYASRRIR